MFHSMKFYTKTIYPSTVPVPAQVSRNLNLELFSPPCVEIEIINSILQRNYALIN